MPARLIRVVPETALEEGIEQIKREAGVPEAFPPDVLAEADAAAARPLPERERVELPFVTIDPPGARDLDQALHIARVGEGHRVSYAIAAPGVFITPGGPLDRDTHARGVTVYAAGAKVPLHPPVLSEGAASLLPGQWRPAGLWALDFGGAGGLVAAGGAVDIGSGWGRRTRVDGRPPGARPQRRAAHLRGRAARARPTAARG